MTEIRPPFEFRDPRLVEHGNPRHKPADRKLADLTDAEALGPELFSWTTATYDLLLEDLCQHRMLHPVPPAIFDRRQEGAALGVAASAAGFLDCLEVCSPKDADPTKVVRAAFKARFPQADASIRSGIGLTDKAIKQFRKGPKAQQHDYFAVKLPNFDEAQPVRLKERELI